MSANKCIISGMTNERFLANMTGTGNEININCSFEMCDKISVSISGNNNRIIIEEGVKISEVLFIFICDSGNLVHLKKNTTVESMGISVADNDNFVIIGEDCMISTNVRILASDFHSIYGIHDGIRRNGVSGIYIGNHVWLGYECMILKNTRIMPNSIIGARAVVAGDVGANTVFTGRRSRKGAEVTWSRKRNGNFAIAGKVKRWNPKRLRKISNREVIVCNVENNIRDGMNRIKGFAFWEGRESINQEVYLFYARPKGLGGGVFVLEKVQREDVVDKWGDERYLWSGFDSYLPREIISNAESITDLKILVRYGNEWAKYDI